MNYTFPIIRHIDDVLPHIEGFEEIIIADRDWYKVINYMVSTPRLWDTDLPGWMVRRECRGLIFNAAGELISRPLQKFFNYAEKPETQPDQIDLRQVHFIMTKADGSLIRPLVHGNELFLATKMGVTDIGRAARELLKPNQIEWLKLQFALGFTPLFEYVAPTNQIVLHYDEAKLVYLGIRDNFTGVYIYPPAPFERIEDHGSSTDLAALVEYTRGLKNAEGFVVSFASGHKFKIKADEYVRLHNLLDKVRQDRNIIALSLNQELDDALGSLPEEDRVRVRSVDEEFWKKFHAKHAQLSALIHEAETLYGLDKKRIALELVCDPVDKRFVFGAASGRNLEEELLKKAQSSIGSGVNYENFVEWLETT